MPSLLHELRSLGSLGNLGRVVLNFLNLPKLFNIPKLSNYPSLQAKVLAKEKTLGTATRTALGLE